MRHVQISFECSLLKVIFFIFIRIALVLGSHFRGGIIQWRPLDPTPANGSFSQVLFFYRVAFRTSYSSSHYCDQQVINSGAINNGEGYLRCDSGCSGFSERLRYKCTDFNVMEDWTTGIGEILFSPPSNVFDAYYSDVAWIPLINGGNSYWTLRTKVDLNPRLDNGLINSSPQTSITPLIRLSRNCTARILIPVVDPDGDVVRCRYATSSFGRNECSSICSRIGATLDEDRCTLNWTPAQAGFYGVALQIEDYINETATVPLSDIPVQFLIEVVEGDGSCGDAPSFDPVITLPEESCIGVRPNQTFTTRIEAVVTNPSRSITTIATVSPIGMVTTQVQKVNGSDVAYFIDATFYSETMMQEELIFCFSAEDSGRLTSETRCIFLVTATPPPEPLFATMESDSLLSITVDTVIRKPESSRLIRIVSNTSQTPETLFTFDSSTDDEITISASGTNVEIELPLGILADGIYQVHLDRGAIETYDFCGVESEPASFILRTEIRAHVLVHPAAIYLGRKGDLKMIQNFPPEFTPSFRRAIVTGTGFGLPNGIEEVDTTETSSTIKISRDRSERQERIGVFTHEMTSPNKAVSVGTVVHWRGRLTFAKATVTAYRGEDLRLGVMKPHRQVLRWRRNGKLIRRWNGKRSIKIEDVKDRDAGVYECYRNIYRRRGEHGIIRVIVPDCPRGKFGEPDCNNIATEECLNGGVLRQDIDFETCICAPGFGGRFCEKMYGPGVYGQYGNLPCPKDDCKGSLICQIEPYGCSCASGFKGPICEEECEDGTFGADCEGICHCHQSSSCDPVTGQCRNGMCAMGWRGENCQISDVVN